MSERGSVGVVLLGVVALAMLLALAVADVGVLLGARLRAAAAADAAALAAAPVTFRPFGSTGTAHGEAVRFARLNGARLTYCRCRHDPSWRRRAVEVGVAVDAATLLFGTRSVAASSRAEFVPTNLGDIGVGEVTGPGTQP